MDQHGPYDPDQRDEDEALRLQAILDTTELRAEGHRPRRCDGCRYYLNPGDTLAYCWHPRLRILVGGAWSCRHHDPGPGAG